VHGQLVFVIDESNVLKELLLRGCGYEKEVVLPSLLHFFERLIHSSPR